MKTMTMQEVFDKAVGGVLAQGQQSADGGWCAYRSHGHLKCAVGHLIPDAAYSPDMDTHGGAIPPDCSGPGLLGQDHAVVRCLLDHGVPMEALLADDRAIEDGETAGMSLLRSLQRAHDRTNDGHFVPVFRERVQRIAEGFGLQWNFG